MNNPPKNRYAGVIGQEIAVARLSALTDLFEASGKALAHILIVGDSGMGQTVLATEVANELGVPCQRVKAANFVQPGDLTAVLTNLREKQVLLLSDVEMLRKPFSDMLLSVLRDSKLTITIGRGQSSRDHVMEIRPFTLIATCARKSDCPADLLGEFSLVLTMEPYSKTELGTLAHTLAKESGIGIETRAAELVAGCSDGRPAHVATTLRRLTNAINKDFITEEDALRAFAAFGMSVPTILPEKGFQALINISGVEFELLIMGLLTRMGFQAEMTRASGDGGIDIIASLNKPIVGGRYLFQCKRYGPENLVSAPTVRDFYGAVTAERAVKGVLITTSDFTAQAHEFGEKAGLELIGSKQLEKLLLEFEVIQLGEQA